MTATSLDAALATFDVAKRAFGEAIVAAHLTCEHRLWVERATFSTAEWLPPHASLRICRDCRAEIHDNGIYDDWLSHGEYSFRKPDCVDMVMTPSRAGVKTIFSLRLAHDPRPFFKSFAAARNWAPSTVEPVE